MGKVYFIVCVERKIVLELGKYVVVTNGQSTAERQMYFAGIPRPGFVHMDEEEVKRCIERFLLLTFGSNIKLVGEEELTDIEIEVGELKRFEYPEDFPPSDPDLLDHY